MIALTEEQHALVRELRVFEDIIRWTGGSWTGFVPIYTQSLPSALCEQLVALGVLRHRYGAFWELDDSKIARDPLNPAERQLARLLSVGWLSVEVDPLSLLRGKKSYHYWATTRSSKYTSFRRITERGVRISRRSGPLTPAQTRAFRGLLEKGWLQRHLWGGVLTEYTLKEVYRERN